MFHVLTLLIGLEGINLDAKGDPFFPTILTKCELSTNAVDLFQRKKERTQTCLSQLGEMDQTTSISSLQIVSKWPLKDLGTMLSFTHRWFPIISVEGQLTFWK